MRTRTLAPPPPVLRSSLLHPARASGPDDQPPDTVKKSRATVTERGADAGSAATKRSPAIQKLAPPATNPFLPAADEFSRPLKSMTLPANASVTQYLRRFAEVSCLGAGAFSQVFLCVHRTDGVAYAVKRSRAALTDAAERRQAISEMQVMAAVAGCPGLPRYIDSWKEDGMLYIQQELAWGSLTDAITGRNPRSEARMSPAAIAGLWATLGRSYIQSHEVTTELAWADSDAAAEAAHAAPAHLLPAPGRSWPALFHPPRQPPWLVQAWAEPMQTSFGGAARGSPDAPPRQEPPVLRRPALGARVNRRASFADSASSPPRAARAALHFGGASQASETGDQPAPVRALDLGDMGSTGAEEVDMSQEDARASLGLPTIQALGPPRAARTLPFTSLSQDGWWDATPSQTQNEDSKDSVPAGGSALPLSQSSFLSAGAFLSQEPAEPAASPSNARPARVPATVLDVLRVAHDVATGLFHLHRRGIAHGDVKPDNILVQYGGAPCLTDRTGTWLPAVSSMTGLTSWDGMAAHSMSDLHDSCCTQRGTADAMGVSRALPSMPARYVIADLGMAGPRHDCQDRSEGDSRYLAPEVLQMDGGDAAPADMFALGASLLELAVGQPLPAAGALALLFPAIAAGNAGLADIPVDDPRAEPLLPDLPHCPPAVVSLIQSLLALHPSSRPTAEQVLSLPIMRMDAARPPVSWAAQSVLVEQFSAQLSEGATMAASLDTATKVSHAAGGSFAHTPSSGQKSSKRAGTPESGMPRFHSLHLFSPSPSPFARSARSSAGSGRQALQSPSAAAKGRR